jgi:hypothetical protein
MDRPPHQEDAGPGTRLTMANIPGDDGPNFLYGTPLDDTIDANDFVFAYEGNDTVYARHHHTWQLLAFFVRIPTDGSTLS